MRNILIINDAEGFRCAEVNESGRNQCSEERSPEGMPGEGESGDERERDDGRSAGCETENTCICEWFVSDSQNDNTRNR